MKAKVSTRPYIGTKDYIGKDLEINQYIFSKWRELANQYNYAEYATPLVEPAILYKAKSGDEVGGKELYEFTDKGNRQIAIRPEATPSTTRLVAKFYNTTPKPIRVFSILNFMRYERPQRGRLREFWQFNIDLFGSNEISSDIEILKIAIDSVLIFNPPKQSFVLYVNNRPLMDVLLPKLISKDLAPILQKLIDKFTKLSKKEFRDLLQAELGITNSQIDQIINVLNSNLDELANLMPDITTNENFVRLQKIMETMQKIGYGQYLEFKPAIVRGLDYYDGIVFEVFDLNPENNRALFGGGRYNGMGDLFGVKNMPAVGFGAGNITMRLFLESWNLLPEKINNKISVYIPQLLSEKVELYYNIAQNIREWIKSNEFGKDSSIDYAQQTPVISTEMGLKPTTISKAIKYALEKDFDYIALVGEDELQNDIITLKNLRTREQIKVKRE